MKKELLLKLSEDELCSICDALDFVLIHFSTNKKMKKSFKDWNNLRNRISELIPESWGWVE